MAIIKADRKADEKYETTFGGDSERVGVLFRVIQVITDPLNYKPLSPTLEPKEPLFIRLEADSDKIETDENGNQILTMDGFAKMMIKYAEKIEKMYEELNYE